MPKATKSSQARRREQMQKQEQQNKMIQQGATVLAVVAVLVIGYLIFQNVSSNSQAEGGSSPAGTALTGDRPLATLPPAERNDYYTEAPEMTIDTNKTYQAEIQLAAGDIRIELFDDQTPVTVNSFVFLANQGFYDGVIFHRVLDGFMAQGGDPSGIGTGGPGYSFIDEFTPDLLFDRPGLLAMANSGPATNGSQFFITFATPTHLNGAHTIFGEVIEGMDIVNGITRVEPGQPGADVIEQIVIFESE